MMFQNKLLTQRLKFNQIIQKTLKMYQLLFQMYHSLKLGLQKFNIKFNK